MKKITFLVGLLAIVVGLSAQQARMNASRMVSNKLFVGLGGAFTGVTITQQNFYGEPEMDYAVKFGNAFSFNVGYLLNEHFGFESGVSITNNGVAYEDIKQNGTFFVKSGEGYVEQSVSFVDINRDVAISYLNIPLLVRFSLGSPENRTKFRFLVGPQFSILRDASQVYTRVNSNEGPMETYVKNTNGDWFSVTDTDINDRIEKNDIQMVFDIGSDFLIGNKLLLSTGLRANYGFRDVNAEAYRLKSLKDGVYVESHHLYGGVYLSLNYLIGF